MELLDGASQPQEIPIGTPEGPAILSPSTIERGRGPRPGIYRTPYQWRDVVDSPPPRRRARGEGAYVLYHDTEPDADTRITYSTLITVDPGVHPEDPNDDILVLETHVGIQGRFLLEFIHRERKFMDHVASRWRQRIVSNISRQRRVVKRLPYRWMRRATAQTIRLEGRFMLACVRGVRGTSRALVSFPDDIYTRAAAAKGHLSDRLSRRVLIQGMRDPKRLSAPEKRVVFTLSVAALLSLIFFLNNVAPLLPRSIGTAYTAVLSSFLLGVGTAVLLPFPPSELLLIPPYIAGGPITAFLTLFFSKIVGAWLVFFIGDALHSLIEDQTEGRPRMRKVVDWMNRNSAKYGAYILAVFMTIPFLPDTLALYVFAVSGISFRGYILGAAIGTALRYGAVVILLMVMGEGRLHELFG